MVNGAMMQPVIPKPADKVQSSNSKPGDTTFQDMMDKTANQKTEETSGENETEGRQQSTPISDVLAQLFFHPEEILLNPELAKVTEAEMAVAVNEPAEEVLIPETGTDTVKTADMKQETGNVFAGQVKAAAATKEVLAEEKTMPVVKEETITKDNAGIAEAVMHEGKAKTVNAESSKTGKAEESSTVNTENNAAKSTEISKPLETKADEGAVKTAAETVVQNNTEAMVYVEQQVSRPETMKAQTVTVNPENPQQMMKDISDSMIKNILSGKQEFELQLEPLNLGKLSIKVTYEAGKTAVSIICSSAKTLEAMSQNAKEIGNILETRLGAETAIIVEHPESDYLEQYNQQKQDSQQEQKEQSQKQANRKDTEQVNFLQQLRLGLI